MTIRSAKVPNKYLLIHLELIRKRVIRTTHKIANTSFSSIFLRTIERENVDCENAKIEKRNDRIEQEKRKRKKCWLNPISIYNSCYDNFHPQNVLSYKNLYHLKTRKLMEVNQLAIVHFSSQAKKGKEKTKDTKIETEEKQKDEKTKKETLNKTALKSRQKEDTVQDFFSDRNLKKNNNTIKGEGKGENEEKKKGDNKEKENEVNREEKKQEELCNTKDINTEKEIKNEQIERAPLKKMKIKNKSKVKIIYEKGKHVTKVSFSYLKQICKTTKNIIVEPHLLVDYYHKCMKNIKHTLVWVKTGILLFLTNMKISKNLIIKRLKGYRLSYSEYKLLIRTMNDMFKLIPFSFFIIIPFAEFLLPVFLKIYPNLLPSTFKNDDNFNNIKKNLYAKQQLAIFLQKLIEEKEKQLNENINADMDLDKKIVILNKFHQQLINKDEKDINPFLSVNDTLKIAKLFKEDFVLDKMNLKTLQAICHLLGLKPYGMHYHVVLQLRHHFLRLQREDRELIYEGVDYLKKNTLIEICKDRGMNFNTSEKEMILQIKQWLQLASIKEVPYILLLYIRCVIVTHSIMDIHDEQTKTALQAHGERQVNTSPLDEKEKLIQEAKEKLDDLKMKEEEIKKNINKETKDENAEGYGEPENEREASEDAQILQGKMQEKKKNKGKKLKIDVLKHNKYMQNELNMLKQICDLQHKELKIAFTSLTDLAEKKQTCDINEIIKNMAERLANIEKYISELNAHKQIEMDEYFYPEEEEEEEEEEEKKTAHIMNLKS